MQTLLLEWRKVATSHNISPEVIESAELHEWVEPVSRMLVVSLTTFVLTDRLGPEKVTREAKVPETWWQHTKLVHFPTFSKWLRRPPRMRTIELTVNVEDTVLFPHAERTYPSELGKPVFHRAVNVDFQPPA